MLSAYELKKEFEDLSTYYVKETIEGGIAHLEEYIPKAQELLQAYKDRLVYVNSLPCRRVSRLTRRKCGKVELTVGVYDVRTDERSIEHSYLVYGSFTSFKGNQRKEAREKWVNLAHEYNATLEEKGFR